MKKLLFFILNSLNLSRIFYLNHKIYRQQNTKKCRCTKQHRHLFLVLPGQQEKKNLVYSVTHLVWCKLFDDFFFFWDFDLPVWWWFSGLVSVILRIYEENNCAVILKKRNINKYDGQTSNSNGLCGLHQSGTVKYFSLNYSSFFRCMHQFKCSMLIWC